MRVWLRWAGAMAVALALARGAGAQLLWNSADARAAFEVATIKPAAPGASGLSVRLAAARFAAENASVKDLIKFAYYLASDDQLARLPGWAVSERFDVEARLSDAQVTALKTLAPDRRFLQYRFMMQSLLAERLQLKLTNGTQQLPVYALTVARGGPKFKPAANVHLPGIARTGETQVTASSLPMSLFADWLSRRDEAGGRVVIDETGLAGDYDFTLEGVAKSQDAEDGVSLFTILEEQLGLKLVAKKGPVSVLTVDRMERPSAN